MSISSERKHFFAVAEMFQAILASHAGITNFKQTLWNMSLFGNPWMDHEPCWLPINVSYIRPLWLPINVFHAVGCQVQAMQGSPARHRIVRVEEFPSHRVLIWSNGWQTWPLASIYGWTQPHFYPFFLATQASQVANGPKSGGQLEWEAMEVPYADGPAWCHLIKAKQPIDCSLTFPIVLAKIYLFFLAGTTMMNWKLLAKRKTTSSTTLHLVERANRGLSAKRVFLDWSCAR